jgi:hypothetical protein
MPSRLATPSLASEEGEDRDATHQATVNRWPAMAKLSRAVVTAENARAPAPATDAGARNAPG